VPDEPDPRVEVVWTLAQQDLTNQFAALDELRARVGSLLAAAAIATGFLSAQSFSVTNGFPFGAWIASIAAAALVAVCGYVLSPRKWQGGSVDPTIMLDDIKLGAYPDLSALQQHMISFANDCVVKNQPKLRWRYRAFTLAIILLVIDFAGWILALTHR
jgi:hypothetical protein